MLRRVAEYYYLIPSYLRWLLILLPGLVLVLTIARPVLNPVWAEMRQLEEKIDRANSQVDWYRANRTSVSSLRLHVQSLSQQIQSLEQSLEEYNQQGAEQFLIDTALQTGVVPDHVKTLQISNDESGEYVRTRCNLASRVFLSICISSFILVLVIVAGASTGNP